MKTLTLTRENIIKIAEISNIFVSMNIPQSYIRKYSWQWLSNYLDRRSKHPQYHRAKELISYMVESNI